MSVIAKLNVLAVRSFGSGTLVEMGCICANDLMTAYAESEEDKLFTRYSPWGEARFQIGEDPINIVEQDQFYIMVLRADERCNGFEGATYFAPARCLSLADFGDGQAKRVEFCSGHRKEVELSSKVTSFNWKMSVDNPLATDQFLPGKDDYWVALYPVSKFDRDQTIAAAHGPSPKTDAAAAEVEEAVA